MKFVTTVELKPLGTDRLSLSKPQSEGSDYWLSSRRNQSRLGVLITRPIRKTCLVALANRKPWFSSVNFEALFSLVGSTPSGVNHPPYDRLFDSAAPACPDEVSGASFQHWLDVLDLFLHRQTPTTATVQRSFSAWLGFAGQRAVGRGTRNVSEVEH